MFETDDSDSDRSDDDNDPYYSPTDDEAAENVHLHQATNHRPRRSTRLGKTSSSASTIRGNYSPTVMDSLDTEDVEVDSLEDDGDNCKSVSGPNTASVRTHATSTNQAALPSKKCAHFPSINCTFDPSSIFSSHLSENADVPQPPPTFDDILYRVYKHSLIGSQEEPEPCSRSLLEKLNWHKDYAQIACAMCPDSFSCKLLHHSQLSFCLFSFAYCVHPQTFDLLIEFIFL